MYGSRRGGGGGVVNDSYTERLKLSMAYNR